MKSFKEYLIEARPRLIKFTIKRNHIKWTIRNEETNKIYYIKMDESDLVGSLHSFLQSIKAHDEVHRIRTDSLVNYGIMAREINNKGVMAIWVPSNREHFIKSTWAYREKREEDNKSLSGLPFNK